MLSVIGGLWVMSGSAPLAAQTAGRSFSSPIVAPGAEFTVTIAAANYGGFGGVIDTLPTGFSFVSSALGEAIEDTPDGRERVRFILFQAPPSFTYVVKASSVSGPYTFEGSLTDVDQVSRAVGGASVVTVSGDATVTPDPAPPVATGYPQVRRRSGQGREGRRRFGSTVIRSEATPWSGPELTPLRLWSALGLMTMIPLSVKSGTSLLRRREAASSVST